MEPKVEGASTDSGTPRYGQPSLDRVATNQPCPTCSVRPPVLSPAWLTATVDDPARIARAVSAALSDLGVTHAVIGGAACQLLGSARTTRDVDFVVDVRGAAVRDLKARVAASCAQFVFRAPDPESPVPAAALGLRLRDSDVPIEFLPTDALGWPAPLAAARIRAADAWILHPAAIVLSKAARTAPNLGSSRPATRAKVLSDLEDIAFLVPRALDGLEHIWPLYTKDKQARLRTNLAAISVRSPAAAEIQAALPDEE